MRAEKEREGKGTPTLFFFFYTADICMVNDLPPAVTLFGRFTQRARAYGRPEVR